MKSLLRKKTPTDNIKKPSSPSSTHHARQPPTVETPLYARFASTKPAVQPLEGTRPVVSGPMPLGRPSRANLEADNRRKHEEENRSRRRLSRRVHTGPESLPAAREVQSSINRPSQDVPVDLTRPPIQAQMACKSYFSFSSHRAWTFSTPSIVPSWMAWHDTCREHMEHLCLAALLPSIVTGSLLAGLPWFCGFHVACRC
jgi:hypothetical protein